jgi:hypothetical protein
MGQKTRVVAACSAMGVALMACGLAVSGTATPDGGIVPLDSTVGTDTMLADDAPLDVAPVDAPGGPDALDASAADASDVEVTDASADADAPFDAPADANPSLCDGGFLFCDGFEQGLVNWSTQAVGGTPTIDSSHVYRGTKALRAHINAVQTAGTTVEATAQHSQSWPSHVFARFFAYAPSPWAPSPGALLNLLQNGAPNAGIQLFLNSTTPYVSMTTYNVAQPMTWYSATGKAPLDQWVCFEVEVDVSGNGHSHAFMNDTEVTDLAQNNLGLPALGILGVGLGFFQSNVQNAEDVWIDEVAVDTKTVGCAK